MGRSGVEKMTRKAYPSDVTDTEWQIIEPLLPEAQDIGRPRQVAMLLVRHR
jgi:transposase